MWSKLDYADGREIIIVVKLWIVAFRGRVNVGWRFVGYNREGFWREFSRVVG